MWKYQIGQKAYIIESIWVKEVLIVSKGATYYVIKYMDCNRDVRVKENRLFESEQKAKMYLYKK